MVEPKLSKKEAQEEKEAWEKAGKPKPETSVERAAREARERGRPLPTRLDVNEYLQELWRKYDELVREGVLYPGQRDQYWEQTYDYIQQYGLTAALPYYKDIQERQVEKKFGEEWGEFEKSVLEYGGTYDQKLQALIGAHPRNYDPKVFRDLKHKVWLSLGEEERKERERESRRRDKAEERLRAEQMARYAPRYAPAPTPAMRYEPAFEEMRGGLAGPQPWKDWFERMYGTLIRRYKGVEAEPTEATWAEYLRTQKARLREEWYGAGAYQRGERPPAFAPKIRTVTF